MAAERECIFQAKKQKSVSLWHHRRKVRNNQKFLHKAVLDAERAQRAAAFKLLSQQELVSCGSSQRAKYETPFCLLGAGGVQVKKYTGGCDGGSATGSFLYMHDHGLPEKSCIPYVSGGVDASGNGGEGWKNHFDVTAGKVPLCKHLEEQQCHMNHRVFSGPPVRIEKNDVTAIMQAIYKTGIGSYTKYSRGADLCCLVGFLRFERSNG